MSVWYRIENYQTASSVDEFDRPLGASTTHIRVCKFEVLKTTPKGVWLNAYHGKRFVLFEAQKKFACPTLEEAEVSFLARKLRQTKILTAQLATVSKAINLLKEGKHREFL